MKIRGQRLQTAIQLVSEGNLTPAEVATRIGVGVPELLELMQDALFRRRVKEVRRARVILRKMMSAARPPAPIA